MLLYAHQMVKLPATIRKRPAELTYPPYLLFPLETWLDDRHFHLRGVHLVKWNGWLVWVNRFRKFHIKPTTWQNNK